MPKVTPARKLTETTDPMQDRPQRGPRSRPGYRGSGSKPDFRRSPAHKNPRHGAANAKQSYERYMALARAAALAGDEIEMENCYQHAEHYFRVMREQAD
jgi:Domain of unknown function (DUF4167)